MSFKEGDRVIHLGDRVKGTIDIIYDESPGGLPTIVEFDDGTRGCYRLDGSTAFSPNPAIRKLTKLEEALE